LRKRLGHIPIRVRYYVGCEGESEQSYVKVLQELSDANNGHVNLHTEVLRRGDPLSRIEAAQASLTRLEDKGRFLGKFALLDTDQRERDPDRGGKAQVLADKLGIKIIWQVPCHEGFLLRHVERAAVRKAATSIEVLHRLRRHWKAYEKGMPAAQLRRLIDLEAVRKARPFVTGLDELLWAAGLLPR